MICVYYASMKANEVLKITGITRNHLYRLVKQGKIRVCRKPNGQYDYNIHYFSIKHYSKRRVKRAIEVACESTENQD
jgi:predicted site-specific integrase-resolvase